LLDEQPLSHSTGNTGRQLVADHAAHSQQHLGDKQDDIIKAVESEVTEEALAKKMNIYFCHRYSGASLRDIGKRFGLSEAAVAQADRKMRVAYENDVMLRKLLDVVEAKIYMSAVEI
jgi:chromosomal replication initiation ATPase DnaA